MAADHPPEATAVGAKQLDLAFAREFLEVNRKEIELRSQELGLRKEQQTQAHELSITSLRGQGTDRQDERIHQRKVAQQYLVFASVLVLALLGFALVAMGMGREAVVMEALKLLAPFIGGLGAGVFLGYRKGQREGAAPGVFEDAG